MTSDQDYPKIPPETKIQDMGLPADEINHLSPQARQITIADLIALEQKKETPEQLHLSVEDVKNLDEVFTKLIELAKLAKADPADVGSGCCCCRIGVGG
jgi:hypothetical protein